MTESEEKSEGGHQSEPQVWIELRLIKMTQEVELRKRRRPPRIEMMTYMDTTCLAI